MVRTDTWRRGRDLKYLIGAQKAGKMRQGPGGSPGPRTSRGLHATSSRFPARGQEGLAHPRG